MMGSNLGEQEAKWDHAHVEVGPIGERSVSRPTQPVDATQTLNLSAGVSNCKVSRGRSFSVAENKRVGVGRMVQRHVLDLGEINDT
jgi:ribosomal protein L13E